MIHGDRNPKHRRIIWCVLALSASATVPLPAQSPIVDDGSLGLNGGGLAVNADTVTIPDNLGATVGNNLFHSFTRFDVPAGVTARFNGAGTIQNVIARVSGTGASQIDGTIDTKTAMPAANFFLMNPNGISFGSGAALNVGGSVLFTTADELGFTDGRTLPAKIPVTEDLSSVAVNRFGFLSQTPGDITFGGSHLLIRESDFLSVPGSYPGVREVPSQVAKDPQSLTAIGGDVKLQSGTQIASTALNLIAVGDRPAGAPTGARNINLDPTDKNSRPTGETLGRLDIAIDSFGSVYGYVDSAVVRLRGGNISLVDSEIYAYGSDSTGLGMAVDTPGTISAVDSIFSVYAREGGLELNARDIRLTRGERVTPYVEVSTLAIFDGGSPRAGDVKLRATDSITIEGWSVFSNATDGHASGNVEVTAGGTLRVGESTSSQADIGEISTIAANSQRPSTGADNRIGDVTVTAGDIELVGAAEISSSSFRLEQTVIEELGNTQVNRQIKPATEDFAKSGDVSVTAAESLVINGQRPANPGGDGAANNGVADGSTGIFSQFSGQTKDLPNFIAGASGPAVGDAGNVTVAVGGTGILSLLNGGQISSSGSRLEGSAGVESEAGKIAVNARLITIDGASSGIFSESFLANASATRAEGVTVNGAYRLNLSNGGRISSQSQKQLAGDIRLENFAAGAIVQLDGANVTALSGGDGKAGGDIFIQTPETLVLLNSEINASASGSGANGGNISLSSGIFLRQNSTVDASSRSGVSGSVTGADLPINLSDVVAPVQAVPVGDSPALPAQNAVFRSGDVTGHTVAGRGRRPMAPRRYELSFEAAGEKEKR